MFAITMAAVLLGAADEAGKSDFTYELRKKDDTIVANVEKDRVIFLVTNESGIGGVTLSPKQGKWPKEVVIRLRYSEGHGFKMLESFGLHSPHMDIDGNLKSNIYATAPDAKSLPIKVPAEVKEGFLEISLPPGTLAGTDKIELSWIDAFRR